MFIALVHAIFHFIMHAWKGRKRAQLEKNEIFMGEHVSIYIIEKMALDI